MTDLDEATPTGGSVGPRICVGIATRGRPVMLKALLNSLVDLNTDGFECVFVVVENNDQPTVAGIVDAFAIKRTGKVLFEVEPRLGIPFARNRVLEIANRQNADMLAFIDDDETAAPDWLPALVAEMTSRRLDMVGGPVRFGPLAADASRMQSLVWRGLQGRGRRGERKALRLSEQRRDDRIALVTGNWLANLHFVREQSLQFNEALRLSGGEDMEFFVAAKRRGAKTGWASGAIVNEWMDPDRLTLSYQYRKARDSSQQSYHLKYPQRSAQSILRAVGSFLGKVLTCGVHVTRASMDQGASLVAAAKSLGFAVGRLKAVLGARSSHYERITGH